MKFGSVLAVYALFWAFCLFLVLPFRLRHRGPADTPVPGQAHGAPPQFSLARTAKWTTIVATAAFVLFYLNWTHGWLRPEMLDLYTPFRRQ